VSPVTEPITAGEVSCPSDPIAQAVARPSRPFGIVATFGWVVCASAAAALIGATLIVALVTSARQPLNDVDALLFICVAATIAEAAFFAVILWACRRRGWRAADYLGLTRPRGNYLRWSLLAFLLALAVSIVTANFDRPYDPGPVVGLLASAAFLFWIVIVAPIGEELIFRGFLYRGIAASRLGIIGAILVTSLLWASGHTDRTWLGFADVLFSGLVLGWVRWRSDSTITTIAIHGAKNIIAAVGYFF
jgi:uncharacterized protein